MEQPSLHAQGDGAGKILEPQADIAAPRGRGHAAPVGAASLEQCLGRIAAQLVEQADIPGLAGCGIADLRLGICCLVYAGAAEEEKLPGMTSGLARGRAPAVSMASL